MQPSPRAERERRADRDTASGAWAQQEERQVSLSTADCMSGLGSRNVITEV